MPKTNIEKLIENPDGPMPVSRSYSKPKKPQKLTEMKEINPKPLKPTANQIAYDLLRSQGLNSHRASKELGISKSYGHLLEHRTGKTWTDAIANLMPKSLKVIKKLSAGEPVGQMADIKGSDVIAANKMIWDRVAPIQSEAPQVSGNSFTQININVLNDSTIPQPPSILIPQNE